MFGSTAQSQPATLVPLGDAALLVRFATILEEGATRRALAFHQALATARPNGVVEIAPNLVSVLLRYDPRETTFGRLAGEVRLLIARSEVPLEQGREHQVRVQFDGPDISEVSGALGLSVEVFIERHNATPLRVLGGAFAPGFLYCGLHPEEFRVPRRTTVRPSVPPGSVLFAAGQTAITSTTIPTGWAVIGHTEFNNFNPMANPPTIIRAGDIVQFVGLS